MRAQQHAKDVCDMKKRLSGFAAACCIAAAFCGDLSAEAVSAVRLRENYAEWRQNGLSDGGMLQRYVQELSFGAELQGGYFVSAGEMLSAVTTWFSPEIMAAQRGVQYLNVMIPEGDSAMFCVKSPEDAGAAEAVLQKYEKNAARQSYSVSGTCFRLTNRSQADLDAIRQELAAADLSACFYYHVPVYQKRQLTVPYLTGYSDSQNYSPADRGKLTAEELQAYLGAHLPDCTLYTEKRTYNTEFFVVPQAELTFQAHWELALQLYRDLGIVPDMSTDLAAMQSPVLPVCAGVPFDVSADDRFSADDIAAETGYLLGSGSLSAPQAGDLNADGRITAADLTLMKRVMLGQKPPAAVQPSEPPITAVQPSMPSLGTVRVPVFAVTFPDCFQMDDEEYTLLRKRCFSAADPGDANYPHESIAAYFDRASCGRLRLTGDVIPYTAEKPIGSYAGDDGRTLADEILAATDGQLDFRDYDADGNGILDSFVIALPDMAAAIDADQDRRPDWWPFSAEAVTRDEYDGVRAGTFCVLPYEPKYTADFVCRTAHELCHAMGLPDYYQYAAGDSGESDGLDGEAGDELMDEGDGDLSACSKLLLGWIPADGVQVYTGGTQRFFLPASPDVPSCIMIPKDPAAGLLSEYFLIELLTPEGNQREYGGTGVRVLHVQAEVSEGDFGPELTYSNHGKHYDSSHRKQRVLRLVNENGSLLRVKNGQQGTDRIDGSTAGFHWYDADGDLTEETGLVIRLHAVHAGPYYDPASADLSEWISGIAEITVSEAEPAA